MNDDRKFTKLYLDLDHVGPLFEYEQMYNCDHIYEEREKCSRKTKTDYFLLQFLKLLFHKTRRQ